jgi:hypothetical protein
MAVVRAAPAPSNGCAAHLGAIPVKVVMLAADDISGWSRLRRPTMVQSPPNHISGQLYRPAVAWTPGYLYREKVTTTLGSHGGWDYSPPRATWLQQECPAIHNVFSGIARGPRHGRYGLTTRWIVRLTRGNTTCWVLPSHSTQDSR